MSLIYVILSILYYELFTFVEVREIMWTRWWEAYFFQLIVLNLFNFFR